jgi:hypothetical protein
MPVRDGELIRAEMRRAVESSCRAKIALLRVLVMSASRCSVAALGFSAAALSKSGVRMTRCLSHAETDSMPALISRSSRVVRISAADRIGIRAPPGASTKFSLAVGTVRGRAFARHVHDEPFLPEYTGYRRRWSLSGRNYVTVGVRILFPPAPSLLDG